MKIDQAFVRDATTDESTAAIVSYIINLAHTMRLSVVAEGVETEEQYAFLQLHGCDYLQGFFFSPALPADQIEPFVRSRH